MASNNKKCANQKSIKWTEEELELYAIILSSEENSFASALEKLAQIQKFLGILEGVS